MMRYISILLLFALVPGCTSSNPAVRAETSIDLTVHILFIGNSLTYANDLPDLVKQQAREKGISIETRMIAMPNYALIDHLADGILQEEIRNHPYDFVVVQQGPSSQAEGRDMLIEAGDILSRLCHAHHARLAFFMVWPSRSYQHTFADVIENYTEAAFRVNAILCPVGQVWKNHIDTTGEWDYYGPDGFHPSPEGSRVAAQVIVESLFDQ